MIRLNKLTAFAAVVALSGGLAACGGGSSKPTMSDEQACVAAGGQWNADMTCTTAAQLEAAAIAKAIADAKRAADALTAQSTDADVAAAKGLIQTALGLISSAKHASVSDTTASRDALDVVSTTVTTAEGNIAAYRTGQATTAEATKITNAINEARKAVDALTAESSDAEVTAANSLITAAQKAIAGAQYASAADTTASNTALDTVRSSLTMAQTTINNHRKALQTAQNEEVGTKLAAMNVEAGQGNDSDAGLGGSNAPANNQAGYTSLAVDKDGSTVTVTVQAGTSADEDKDTTYDVADLGGGRTMHELVGDADNDGNVETQTVIVSHDRKAPKPVAFVKFQAENGTFPQTLDTRKDGKSVSTEDPADSLIVGTDAAVRALVASGSFTAGTAATLTFDGDNPNDATDSAFTGDGSYNGAMGTYMCNGGATDCTVQLNADGEIIALSDNWIFTPKANATSSQTDYDYLRYGFWLKKTADADGVVTYDEVETFANAVSMANSAGTVTGSASYSGGATGVYVHHVFTEGGGTIASRTAGHFSADASLKAYFGQPTANNIPPNKLNTITGTISDFVLSGGEANDWSVALEGNIDLDGGDNRDFIGDAKGGVGDGDLEGNFYGATDTLPVAATGEFNATMSNGAVAGAFGVNKDE